MFKQHSYTAANAMQQYMNETETSAVTILKGTIEDTIANPGHSVTFVRRLMGGSCDVVSFYAVSYNQVMRLSVTCAYTNDGMKQAYNALCAFIQTIAVQH
jgi:hypothetical protein